MLCIARYGQVSTCGAAACQRSWGRRAGRAFRTAAGMPCAEAGCKQLYVTQTWWW